ncbi:acetylornithine transaminase [Microlunatus soli]|uniref:Acetylornithine aminotransferase n=1 Tax=Microlunatus soli TaxID=630515 RepID=A0A1H1XXZ6_9ACTN|nr:acetylornithine transaminase [Microlunatus soli]SDT13911.1 acetylornithine aminotransferase [Microlunatus soli]
MTELQARIGDSTAVSDQLSSPTDRGSAALLNSYDQHLMHTFGRPKRVFVRGEGCYVWDTEGTKHLDLLSGLAVNALGHAHPTVLSAITGQIATLGHVSNFFATPSQVALAEKLTSLVAADAPARVFFANSGTEANEAAFKITRLTGKTKIISTEGSFHGRSIGALAITANEKYRKPFEPLPGDVEFVPYGDIAALEAAIDDQTAAVVLEPIQGENGVVVPPDGYLTAARKLASAHGALLWLDEVQTGIGRTGYWLESMRSGVVGDIVTVAKGLGNGFPIGACVAIGPAADLLAPGSHGSTFGGNPVACIAGLAVLSVIERDDLLANATEQGARLSEGIAALDHPAVDHVRGQGLLRGVVLTSDIAQAVTDAALDGGFIINAPRPNVLRIAPPLIITSQQIDTFIEALPTFLGAA